MSSSSSSSSSCQCGDDVTFLIYQTLGNVINAYINASQANKDLAFYNLFTFPWALSSWDINWLLGYPSPPNPPGCNCDNTVTFEGYCVNDNELNYILWGYAAYICGSGIFTRSEALAGLRAALEERGKDPPDVLNRKVNAAGYGWDYAAGTALPSEVSSFAWPAQCEPSKKKGSADTTDWKWTPLQ